MTEEHRKRALGLAVLGQFSLGSLRHVSEP